MRDAQKIEPHQIDLPKLFGGALTRLPYIHRIFLENLARHAQKDLAAQEALTNWMRRGRTDIEVPFYPFRIMMHDTTCGPALADLAALRSALAEAGADPCLINPVLQVDVSTDHSLAVDESGFSDALALNMQSEMRRNDERYRFMKWAAQAFDNLHLHPPGSGIMHTINIEQLASVVVSSTTDGEQCLYPESLIGTDSHTPMINGLGVLAWGVGGLEAESVMLGKPVMQLLPSVVGVRLTGRMPEHTYATDLALAITHRLRQYPLNGQFVEFFGSGVATLPAGVRCVVANMAPEYGGATGYFPADHQTLSYLRETGRPEEKIREIECYMRAQHLWGEPSEKTAPGYADIIEFDLCKLEPVVSGPHRPQDARRLSTARHYVYGAEEKAVESVPTMPIGIAAITSCTNTSDPRLLIAAGIVAKKARAFGLAPPEWVKTSLAPGSPAAKRYLTRAGLLEDLEAIGFSIIGYGCTTCIGNAGPLNVPMARLIASGEVTPVAVLSGNRNFPGRVHADITESFLASPALVVAYALAGDFSVDISSEVIGKSKQGKPIFLNDILPSASEIESAMQIASRAEDFKEAFEESEQSEEWNQLSASDSVVFSWDEGSSYIRRPPFVSSAVSSRLGRYTAHPLLVLGDDITTDHISPAGAVPTDSAAARYLIERGADPSDLNVYSARRANWEVMLRGLFTNSSVRNLFSEDLKAGQTIHAPSGDRLALWEAAARYQRDNTPVVILAGKRYGMGSSRDWAAKGVHLLGVRAVIANSFERIHRSNLVNMGVLPLILPADIRPQSLAMEIGDTIEIYAAREHLAPNSLTTATILRQSGKVTRLHVHAAVETADEVETLRCGGLLPRILQRYI